MSSLGRIKRILQAVIQDLIDRAHDPEMELVRFIDEVELSLGEVRAERLDAEQQRDRLTAAAAENDHLGSQWMTKAEAAAAKGDDPAAKEALRRHRDCVSEAAVARERLNDVEQSLAILRHDEAELEHKFDQARLEQKRLSAKLRRAESEQRAGAALRAPDFKNPAEHVRGRIMDSQAAGEASREVHRLDVNGQFAEMHRPPSLDDELAALKRRVKGAGRARE